ncbi:unnamed protein product (macronuclear) [Paramecium tetraurelia]|uniref:Uncharacterized protein n=1 Tax=Paramecium tetraurelia TaxID=5888 RepID=A0CWA8_PARTE|nr:uncharacterized protein GSPATT00001277001 [Paramecium tetraurelia]CAK75075.1 unnamed protein product [Paramecium tetraurelia]|eukprot:XP_001442472.1 hypothetical protein (macronuclear) [Paramecium tetraurelia strain d4-2]
MRFNIIHEYKWHFLFSYEINLFQKFKQRKIWVIFSDIKKERQLSLPQLIFQHLKHQLQTMIGFQFQGSLQC